jgi:flagellar biosynthesis/type III secretory pathway M-ring protein FliF/YscJ
MRTASSPNSLSKICPLAIALTVLAIFLIIAWQWRKNLSDEPGVDQQANQTVQSDEQSGKKPEPTDAKNPSSMDGKEPASSKRIKLEKKLKLANFSHQETTAVQRSVNEF